MSGTVQIDTERHLGVLKDFQRNTVEYLYRRMYTDSDPTLRFLVADEAGLGKTMVARGLIAKAIEWLNSRDVDRIDVVYVCSNSAIAAQNLARLNILESDQEREKSETSFATRLTLLPIHVRNLNRGKGIVNFISFTPGTTFDMRSSGGTMQERAVLFWMLKRMEGIYTEGLRRLLRCAAGWKNWGHASKWWEGSANPPNEEISEQFREALMADEALWRALQEMAERFRFGQSDPESGLSAERYAVVGRLRTALAKVCLDALEPDLIIMDEFQRFKHLLDPKREEAQLAQQMFSYRHPDDPPPRVLLLSATPYKMFTVAGEAEDQHYRDFIETLRFLLDGDQVELDAIQADLSAYRHAMRRLGSPGDAGAKAALMAARDAIQARLLKVMVRTERVSSSQDRNAMVREHLVMAELTPSDLKQAVAVDAVARAAGASDIIEYWKSAPYLLNFMKGYDLQRRIRAHQSDQESPKPASDALLQAIKNARPHMLNRERVQKYQKVDPANGRLRALTDDMLEQGLWALLWMPPSMPYLQPRGPYAEVGEVSKTLVFSSWNLVPDTVAALASYESERRMLAGSVDDTPYEELTKQRRGVLRFAVSGDRYAGMGALLLAYPSPSLVQLADPLRLALQAGGEVLDSKAARRDVAQKIGQALVDIGLEPSPGVTDRDPRWYWAAVAALDAAHHPDVAEWLRAPKGWRAQMHVQDDPDEDTGFTQILDRFYQVFSEPLALGRQPADLLDVLARLALGGPGICSSRALGRLAPELGPADTVRLDGAAAMAEGFRTLFNVPESQGLIRGRFGGEDYWRGVCAHGVAGNLQAVLDEQVHMLKESLGLVDTPAQVRLERVASEIASTLSLRTASLTVNDYTADARKRCIHKAEPFSFRMRFGLRLGEFHDEAKKVHRADLVRRAFNSPFRPFLLTSTSVGQEGLDFHTWCHTVVHWNLPNNPVDMEQREGRVHRYKGHAIRKNVARRFGLGALANKQIWDGQGDPWARLFDLALEHRKPGQTHLVPFWIFDEVDDPVLVDRKVLMLPFSKETERYEALKRSLALYRLAFGQPRQEELVHWLASAEGEIDLDEVGSWQIDLRAPVG